ncbi:PhnB protein [Andreprevotia lacus DSM 23236]|jgi:PhnB protein|uniref:PhnB protein n=1 Tax=Andreprevotia lacus DSM 23236 TaxID=1121001 RepID=A0A1W1Y264_9NEIS|nr:VOC family protein [Andreprevotia lacus]SMC29881.1 PhnB protein [Andreprevotia lacus DSM 23236]
MNKLNVYLTFNGDCGEAMRFYAEALSGELHLMTVGESPVAEQVPAANANLIMHACLTIPQGNFMASDWMEGCGVAYEGKKGFSLNLTYPTVEEATKRFNALSAGGQITMPFGQTFWAEASGMVTDRFGTPWIVNGGKILGAD